VTLLALTAALAIVVQDHTPLRAAPRASTTELATLWQGDVLEVRDERAGYLKVYDYRRERGGYVKSSSVRAIGINESAAPELLAVVRFLRESPGSESLGISYAAAYLKAVPSRSLTAEPLDAIARMAERMADSASGSAQRAETAAHIEVVEQFGVHMRSFERDGRMQVCYEGELFRHVLAMPSASPEERAHAALGLTRADCIDPDLGPALRAAVDDARQEILGKVSEAGLSAVTRGRLHAARAGVWAAIAFERARRGESPEAAAQQALGELLAVHPDELGDDRRAEYLDAIVRVAAVRWAALPAAAPLGSLALSARPGKPGETCVALEDAHRPQTVALVRRCTYGIVWLASAQTLAGGRALALAVQPLESWRELWVFHVTADGWVIDVLSPGLEVPAIGYVEYAGYAPGTRRLLIARELEDHGRFTRRFEELRLDDLALLRQASTPEQLPDFGRWQDVVWRRDTLALH
jgi:hypothetical protein